MTSRYHPGLTAPGSQIAVLDRGAYIQILNVRFAVCLPPFVITFFSSLRGFHSHHICRSLSWNPCSLPLSLSTEPAPWTNSALFLLSLLSGGWMLLEENGSNFKNVAPITIWSPSGPAGWLCSFSLSLVSLSLVSSVACYVFVQARPTSAVYLFPGLICFVFFHCILSRHGCER